MLYPSIDEMVKIVDSKYSLVVAASKRARILRDGGQSAMLDPKSNKYVGVALEEIYNNYVVYEKAK